MERLNPIWQICTLASSEGLMTPIIPVITYSSDPPVLTANQGVALIPIIERRRDSGLLLLFVDYAGVINNDVCLYENTQ